MKIILYMKKVLSGFYLSIKRFPLTTAFSASTALVLILISETTPKDNLLKRVAMIFALGIPVSLCIKLSLEKIDKRNVHKAIMLYLSGALFLIIYYFLFLRTMDMVSTTRYIAVSISLYLAFLFIPYLLKREQFEMYVITVFTGFFVTTIYSVVLYFGLSAILFTTDKLLGIRILGKIYYYTWLFVMFIFFLLYFLSQVPDENKNIARKSYPKLLRILILYIIMPLLTVYTIILYIYFGKIVLTAKWPVGLVSHLVLWYSIIVIIVLFFITPIKSENSWSNIFLKFSPKIILPPIIMMFVSIGIRINAYGVTERRYFLTILGIWLFFMMIYLSLTKKSRNIMIPVTLSIVILISVFGPQSSYTVSKMSQNSRFEKILIKNNMIKDGNIQTKADVSQNDKYEISSILDYFEKNHSLSDVKYIPKGFKLDDMRGVFGFSFISRSYGLSIGQYNFVRNDSKKYIDITGYDYLFDATNLNSDLNISNSYLYASYNYETSTIKIIYNGNEIYTKNLNSFAQSLIDKYGAFSKVNSLPPEEMTLAEENERVKVKFIFSNISGNISEPSSVKEFGFYMLIKIK